jgi:cytochrome c biogenesis protein
MMKESKSTANVKEESFLDLFVGVFRSLRLTITLLILLAIVSIIGTVITQNATRPEYIERYGIGLYEVLDFFNLFDMYHSWWFSTILLLLVVNLVTCSFHRLPGILRQMSGVSGGGALEDRMLKTLPYVEKVRMSNPTEKEGEIQSYLTKKWSTIPNRIETETAITFYSEKGRFSRLGVPLTHLSILIILIGGLMGSLWGLRGFVNILEGETIDRIYLRTREREVVKPLDFSVRCDDFSITFYDLPRPEKMVKEYTSVLTILENGRAVLTKKVEVNHPLHYRGLNFYQSSYGALHDVTLGVQWKDKKEKDLLKALEGETVPIPKSQAMLRILRYEPRVPTFGEGVQVLVLKPNEQPRALWVMKGFPKFGQEGGDNFTLTFEGVTSKEYTGLQVTEDPGVWVVWVGCSLMILGLIVSFFFSHQRVWVRIPKAPGEIVLGGSTNKNRFGFEKAFSQLVEKVRSGG